MTNSARGWYDDGAGPAVNVLVHTSHPEQLASLHRELRDIVEDIRAHVLATVGIEG